MYIAERVETNTILWLIIDQIAVTGLLLCKFRQASWPELHCLDQGRAEVPE